MRRSARLQRLVPVALALLVASTMPRSAWLVHQHEGGGAAHVHLSGFEPAGQRGERSGPGVHGHPHTHDGVHRHHAHGHAHAHDPAQDLDHAHDLDDAHAHAHAHDLDDAHAHGSDVAGGPGHDDPAADDPAQAIPGLAPTTLYPVDHVHWRQPFQPAAVLVVVRPVRAEAVRDVGVPPPSPAPRVAAVAAAARAPPGSSPASDR